MTTATDNPFITDIARGCRTALAAWRDDLRERADEGDVAAKTRLEFCEVQEELALQEHQQCRAACSSRIDYRCQWCALKAREATLLREHEVAWRASGPCEKCEGRGRDTCVNCIHWKGRVPRDCACGGSRRAPCRACDGTGDRGGLCQRKWAAEMRQEKFGTDPWMHKVHWRAGLPCAVECRLEDVLERVQWVNNATPGMWRATEWAKSVCRHHPVQKFVLVDRSPMRWGNGAAWLPDDLDVTAGDALPNVLFDSCPGTYLTATEANDALATAAGVLVRRAVWDTD